jgi:hypothetical protein
MESQPNSIHCNTPSGGKVSGAGSVRTAEALPLSEAAGAVDFSKAVLKIGFALVAGGSESLIGQQQPKKLNPFTEFRRGELLFDCLVLHGSV